MATDSAGRDAANRQHPTAITGEWSDLERQAEYVYFDEGVPGTTQYELAEAVLVALGENRRLREANDRMQEALVYHRG